MSSKSSDTSNSVQGCRAIYRPKINAEHCEPWLFKSREVSRTSGLPLVNFH